MVISSIGWVEGWVILVFGLDVIGDVRSTSFKPQL